MRCTRNFRRSPPDNRNISRNTRITRITRTCRNSAIYRCGTAAARAVHRRSRRGHQRRVRRRLFSRALSALLAPSRGAISISLPSLGIHASSPVSLPCLRRWRRRLRGRLKQPHLPIMNLRPIQVAMHAPFGVDAETPGQPFDADCVGHTAGAAKRDGQPVGVESKREQAAATKVRQESENEMTIMVAAAKNNRLTSVRARPHQSDHTPYTSVDSPYGIK